jgi:outer membrane protein TolC
MLRARAAIRNAEARIRGLVNDPRFERENIGELLPNDAPLLRHEPLTLQTVLERSVAFRPEVQQVFLQHRLAVLREGQAQIEALPRFDAIAEGNFGGRGLDTFRFDDALADTRRNTDRMGGVIGFRLEIPLGNDNLQAEVNRRRIETRQIENQGRATLATVVSEAEIALTEYNIAFREIGARAIALRAARADTAAERERWTQGVGGAARDPNSLERLLSSIDRLVAAEEALATAQASFSLAFVAIQRVQGTFTAMQSIEIRRIEDAARGPAFVVRRAEATPASASSAGNTPPPSRPVGRTP